MTTSVLVLIMVPVLALNILFTEPAGDGPLKVAPGELRYWVSHLASDEMRGRANGSPEMKTAAEWIKDMFISCGLKPLQEGGSFIQDYTFTTRQQKTVNERNVIGFIEGADPLLKNQYIVVTAHFDHVGVRKGNEADSIYNGADDNAAGTCSLIGVARNIVNSGMRPGRSLIFAAFSGEESGMRGSRHFVSNCPVPLKDIYANINFEMTGHSEYLGRNRYYMTGCKVSELDDIIGRFNSGKGWTLVDTIKLADQLFFASDNISFSRVSSAGGKTTGIPSGTFATTALADYIHSPRDEAAYFDYENMAGLVNHFSELILWLSQTKDEIKFTNSSFEKINQ